MIEITTDKGQLHSLELKLLSLQGEKVTPLLRDAAKRAATHAKKVGKQRVRTIYTIDGSSISTAIKGIRSIGLGAELLIAGPRKSVKHYKARQNKTGVFVSVKKGSGNTVGRSFAYNSTFFHRVSKSRLPIKPLYGPAVPQLFENPSIQSELEQAALNKYEERVAHELSRIIGG